jgi:hypothetical protein
MPDVLGFSTCGAGWLDGLYRARPILGVSPMLVAGGSRLGHTGLSLSGGPCQKGYNQS